MAFSFKRSGGSSLGTVGGRGGFSGRGRSGGFGGFAGGRGFTLQPVNWQLVFVVAALVTFGLTVVYSAVVNNDDYNFSRQVLGVTIGVLVMVAIWQFDYRILGDMTYFFLAVNVILILLPFVPGLGVNLNGAQSWIRIGIQVQPSELAKVTYILMAAGVMARYNGVLDDPIEYLKAILILGAPFVAIMLQPDLGTGLVYLIIGAMCLIMGGARPRFLLLTVGALVVLVLIVLGLDELTKFKDATGEWEYRILKSYQRQRIIVFLDPDANDTGSSYNLRQAQIAIGSGGVMGKGLNQGTQSALGFLPEYPTDFIFCVLGEEFGFVGAMGLLVLYILLFLLCLKIARNSSDLFGMLIVMGTFAMWLFQVLENIGMTIGLMPITGIPLPFMSYGSSFMVVNFIMLGFIGSVWAHGGVKS